MEVMQRQKYILDQLNQRGTIKIAEISKEINVSRETIRKDIYNLDKQGLIQAIRGGATTPQSVNETKYGKRQHEAVSEKMKLLPMLFDSFTMASRSSLTMAQLLSKLPKKSNIVI